MADCTRQLIHVPILHSPGDMGEIGGQLEAAYVEMFGRRRWREHLALLDHFWQAAADAIDGLKLDYGQVDLYQDGLPLCGRELDVVRDAAGESENFRLLLGLAGRGARLIGTEDPKLLVEEYRAIRNKGRAPGGDGRGMENAQCPTPDPRSLLARRDAFIARRIGDTLQSGRIGLLFLGLLHNVRPHLPGDIIVRSLDILAPTSKGSS